MRAIHLAFRNSFKYILKQSKSYKQNEKGTFAVLSAILLPCIIIAAGCALDLSRLLAAKTEAQGSLDAAVLAAAVAGRSEDSELKEIVINFLEGQRPGLSGAISLVKFNRSRNPNVLSASASGTLTTTFMKFVNIKELTFSITAEAKWATEQTIEVAMVLDNTWSMNGEKLQALKKAATELVSVLEKNKEPGGILKIGLVPYADYVNVGLYNRFRSWISVPEEVTTERSCEWKNTARICERGEYKSCSRTVDGVTERYDCTPYRCEMRNVMPYERCVGGEKFSWYGCVGSRTSGTLRLTDESPRDRYPGILSPTKNCLDPIIPLTSVLNEVRSGIVNMVVQVGAYKPSTYIPAGLIWGVNILSPTRPFEEGLAYDDDNRRPRKVLVLMTDGANTMKLDQSTGKHLDTSNADELSKTYSDMQSICLYAQSKKIDVYTVSFLVDDRIGEDAMRSCATSPKHYFDAKNAKELKDAFSNIAASLSSVTLTR